MPTHAFELAPLTGSSLPKPRDRHELGPVDLNSVLVVTFHIRPNPKVAEQKSASPETGVFLSLEEFESQFGADGDDVNAVREFAESAGLVMVAEHANQCMIEFEGSVANCNNAFGVQLKKYDSRLGKFFGHDGEILVPAHLVGVIEAISGLDSLVTLNRVRVDESVSDVSPEEPLPINVARDVEFVEPSLDDRLVMMSRSYQAVVPVAASDDADQHNSQRALPEEPPSDAGVADVSPGAQLRSVDDSPVEPDSLLPAVSPGGAVARDEAATASQTNGYFVSDIAKLYDFPSEYDGTGETIGIISLDGNFDRSDITGYCESQQIKPPSEIVIETIGRTDGRARHSDKAQMMSDGELTMDLEVAASVAPGAKLVVFRVAPQTQHPYVTALRYAIQSPHRPSVVSISYGQAEGLIPEPHLRMANNFFAAVAKMGITICAASGDAGSASRDYDVMPVPPTPGPHVNFPACSPHVLACGGTQIETSQGRITREFAWNDLDQCRLATAGGISTVFERPEYQNGLKMPQNPSSQPGFDGRGVPDIAGNASLFSGYSVLFKGRWFENAGGTSMVAPLMAGLIARLNQALGRRIGFIHPYLYKLAGTDAIRDITQGSNGCYKSGVGWDACTGLGVPVGRALLDALRKEIASNLIQSDKPIDGVNHTIPLTELSRVVEAAHHSALVAKNAAQYAAQVASLPTYPYKFR